MAQDSAKNQIIQTLLTSYKAMPNWLKSGLIIALVAGFFYFGYARKEIIYSKEQARTEEMYEEIGTMNKKIAKIEDIREAYEDMLYNIEEVRGIAATLYQLHRDHTSAIVVHLKGVVSDESYREMLKDIDEEEREYRQRVNELFEKKSREHLKGTAMRSKETEIRKEDE